MKIDFLAKLNFHEITNIEELKTSRVKVIFENDRETSPLSLPDLRYYWDGERFGLHISDGNYNYFDDLFLPLDSNQFLSSCEVLYLCRNKISEFIINNGSFENLKYLNLSQNLDLEEVLLIDLNNLEELHIINCPKLKKFNSLRILKNIKKLDISYCGIEEFEIEELNAIEFLKINNNEIKNLKISKSTNLKYVFASNNKITNFQIESSTPKLNIIDVSFNPDLTDLNLKDNLNELESINLNNTSINLDALRLLKDYENLKEVRLENTPTEQSYPEEVKQGWSFFKLLFGETTVPFLHQKVLLLGDPNVGKSNLLYWWKNKKHPTEKEDKNVTHGVKYSSIDSIIKTPNGNPIRLHFWDFGGQDYFHATHQLFFSKGSLNLLLWAKNNTQRENSDDNLYDIDYWLRCIQQLSYDPDNMLQTDTILIQNKIDLLNKPELLNQIEIENAAYAKNLNLFFANVSINPNGSDVSEPKYLNTLEEIVSDILSKKDFNRPESWSKIYEIIERNQKPVIDLDEIETKYIDSRMVAQYFHDRGLILYFGRSCEDKIFNKPQVFLDFLYNKLFESRKTYKISKIFIQEKIEESDFRDLITDNEVISILKYYNLVFEIPDYQYEYFIPQYLPPKNSWISFFEKYQFSEPDIIIKSDYFLMNQAMLSVYKIFGRYTKKEDEDNLLFWQDGIIIEIESKLLKIKLNRKTQSIEIYFGKDKLKKDLVEFIVVVITNPKNSEAFFDLLNSLSESPKEKIILALGVILYSLYTNSGKQEKRDASILSYWNVEDFEVFLNNGKNQFVSFKELRKNSKNSIRFIHYFRKTELSPDNYLLEKIEEITSIYRFNEFLDEEEKGNMKNLMISYSKDDLSLVNEFTKHLEPLIRNGDLKEWWYCTDLEAGQAWTDEIEPRLKTFDIVCFMISSSFYNTKYIRDKEIQIVMDRYKLEDQKPMIVPIILQPYHWTSDKDDYNLGKFTALPYTAKPVSSFNNRQEAWHIIGECLRVAIRNNTIAEKEDYWLLKEKETLPKDVKLFFEKIIKENNYGLLPTNIPTPSNEPISGTDKENDREQ